jgi:hypothetical protein
MTLGCSGTIGRRRATIEGSEIARVMVQWRWSSLGVASDSRGVRGGGGGAI